MSDSADVAVIIAAFTEQRWDEMVRAIDSARAQTLQPREVIVCIDHNETLLARMREHAAGMTDVQVIHNPWPRGVSGARNAGIAAARAAICAFLDDDAAAAPDWLENLVKPYSEPDVLGVGGAIEPGWHDARPGWFPEEFDWVVGCSYKGLPMQVGSIRNLIGANMSFRRDVLVGVGGFRNDIGRVGEFPPVGCEDTALCIRARQQWPTGRFVYEPRAGVRHSVPRSRAQWRYFLLRCYGEGASKAHLARLFGFADSLSVERTYVTRTLPAGVARSLSETLRLRRVSAVSRGAAIVAGLGSAAAGFIVAAARRPLPGVPVAALEVSP